MQLFHYPYVIITILVIFLLLMGMIGLSFMMKSVKTAKGTVENDFCSIGKIENYFEKVSRTQEHRCMVYISMPLDGMKRLYSESKAIRMYEQVKGILLQHFGIQADGLICVYEEESFVAFNHLEASQMEACIEKCYEEIQAVFATYDALNIAHVNFGYHCTSSNVVFFKTALSRAKQACSMAEAKEELCCQWDSSNGREFERRIKMENNIQNEIDNNRFFLEYQPILDAKENRIVGAEVLARLNSPTEGVLTPHKFLSAVNSVGLSEKFDYYIFEKNCKWIANDMENRMKYVYTINISRNTLCHQDFAEQIIGFIQKYGVDSSCIAIEILEDRGLDENEKATMVRNIRMLKEKGVAILLDDFGKGYTSFGDLTEFDISIVKIDKAITQNGTTQAGFVILKNIIQTAHDLGFQTLCEGIETEEQKNTVVDAGCDLLQGYYFYRPMPVTQLETLFEKA